MALPATSLLCLTLLSACNLGASPEVAPLPVATPLKPAEPPTSELMSQLLPPNSCPNTLENLKFAMRNKLFNRDDFYTDENVRRFFGDYYDIFWDKNKKLKKLSIWSAQKTSHIPKSDSPWVPCFRGGELSKWQEKEKDKEVTRAFFYANSSRYYDVSIDLFETIFGYDKPFAMRPIPIGEYFPRAPHSLRNQENVKRMKEDEEKKVFHHQYGRKKLNYYFKKDSYRAGIEVETGLSGRVFKFSITSEGE